MNKHERAKRLIEKEVCIHRDVMVQAPSHPQHPDWECAADALTYALRVLEAVEGVEEWMPYYIESIIAIRTGQPAGLLKLKGILQAILDAKSDDA